MGPEDTWDPVQSHRVAVLYLMFALAELLNLERTPYPKEADNYFKFARAALAVDSVLEEQSIQAIQALASRQRALLDTTSTEITDDWPPYRYSCAITCSGQKYTRHDGLSWAWW